MSIAELNEQLKFEVNEAGRPYALMFENIMRLEKFRQAVEFEYWRKDDKYVSLTLDQEKFVNYINYEPAWTQEIYDFEILRGEPPLKLYKGILEMPHERQTMFPL